MTNARDAACNNAREPWEGSSRGKAVAVTAPGENVWVAQPGDAGGLGTDVGPGSGTSFAVATVAGMAALWLAYHGRDNLLSRYRDRRPCRKFSGRLCGKRQCPQSIGN